MLTKLGEAHIQLGNYEQALSYFERRLRLSQEFGTAHQQVTVLIHIGKVHLLCGDLESALNTLYTALANTKNLPNSEQSYHIHHLLYRIYKHQGQHEKALNHHEQLSAIRQSLMHQQGQKRLSMMRKAHQTQLHHLHHELQQERELLRQSQIENTTLRQQLKETRSAKDNLLADMDAYSYMVAHDLKAPISIVIGYAQLLLQDLALDEIDDQAKWLHAVLEACEKMNQIIDSLLLIAKINSEEYPATLVDMHATLVIIQRQLKPMMDEYKAVICIETELPPTMGHAPWIEQIWVNYLTNAIKYGGTPPMVCIGAQQVGAEVRYWVKDNGDGLEAAFLEQVFLPFKRARSHHKIKGHGIGLAIVKRIVEKLGGSVKVESGHQPGAGCIFSFSLPAPPTPALEDAPDLPKDAPKDHDQPA